VKGFKNIPTDNIYIYIYIYIYIHLVTGFKQIPADNIYSKWLDVNLFQQTIQTFSDWMEKHSNRRYIHLVNGCKHIPTDNIYIYIYINLVTGFKQIPADNIYIYIASDWMQTYSNRQYRHSVTGCKHIQTDNMYTDIVICCKLTCIPTDNLHKARSITNCSVSHIQLFCSILMLLCLNMRRNSEESLGLI
jgi:hypothetical protein